MFVHVGNGPLSKTDRWGLAVIGLLVGALMVPLGYQDLAHALRVRRWPAVACQILASRVHVVHDQAHEETPYVFDPVYQYTWQGQVRSGGIHTRDYRGSSDINEADALARRYAVGVRTTCRVNPVDPSESALLPEGLLTPAVVIAFGIVFALFLLALAAWPKKSGVLVEGKKSTRFVAFFIGTMFLAFGSTLLYVFFLQGCWSAVRALSWMPTPCQVVSSEVLSHEVHGHIDLTFYRPEIIFTYQIRGRSYRSSHFNFTHHETLWYYGKRGIVRGFPPRLQTTCYVDPADPSRAVLTRAASVTLWGAGFMLTICGLGVYLILHGLGLARDVRTAELRRYKGIGLAVVAGFVVQMFLVMTCDLVADRKVGQDDWKETIQVGLAGVIALGAVAAFVRSMPRRVRAEKHGLEPALSLSADP